ncbi:MAG TPA: ribonuclease H-like domain-containing protein, partial [Anaerolineaceae bacterium]|nr:ribonuclease H-like domain-containing protein [Anaerolineaceae bacterium]
NFLFLDTETTGLGGGTGTYAFLIGLGYLGPDGFHLIQLLMRDPTEEPALLDLLNHYLAAFPAIVTFNGKSFDIPLLNARHVLNGVTTPFGGMQHIDLLPLARRLWRNRLQIKLETAREKDA